MDLFEKSTILITGANGGIGKAFIKELLNRNVDKIYITGIDLEELIKITKDFPQKNVIPMKLDVTNPDDIKKCSDQCSDVNILINNAGVELKSGFISEKTADCAKFEMEINYIGVVRLTNSFYGNLKKNNNSAIINILSVGSILLIDRLATYCASKAATHIFTQAIRREFDKDNIKVFGVYPGYVDTTMSADIDDYKISAEQLVINICNEIENNELNIFPDKMSKLFRESGKINLDYYR